MLPLNVGVEAKLTMERTPPLCLYPDRLPKIRGGLRKYGGDIIVIDMDIPDRDRVSRGP